MARFGQSKNTGPEPVTTPDVITTPAGEVAHVDTAAPAPISPEVAARVRELVAPIPGDDGTGAERIVTQLLNAQTVDDLNAPWEGTSGRSLAGKRLVISSVTQRPSAYQDGAGVFLVVDAADATTGERATFTTSALSTVIQLARCHQLGIFPIIADVVVADRPTARGFYPYHLRIVAASNSGQSQG